MADSKIKADAPENKQLKQAAVALTNHACTLGMRHIQDGMLRLQFNRDTDYVRAYKHASTTALEIDALGGTVTTKGMLDEWRKEK